MSNSCPVCLREKIDLLLKGDAGQRSFPPSHGGVRKLSISASEQTHSSGMVKLAGTFQLYKNALCLWVMARKGNVLSW